MCIVPPPCAPRRALVGSQPHWHSGPNQPLWGPMTLPQLQQFCRSGGVGGSTCTRPSRPGITREQHVSSCIEHVLRTHRELMENRGKLREIVTEPRKGLSSGRQRSPVPRSARKRPVLCWWRGLDSNQRTLARADLQSAAFNHSATSPQRLVTLRPPQRVAGVAIGQARHVAARPCCVNASELEELSPLHCVQGAPKFSHHPMVKFWSG